MVSTGAEREDGLATRADHEVLCLLRTRHGSAVEEAVARILERTPVRCVHTYVAHSRPQLDLAIAVCRQCGETA